nr:kinesin-like protein KIF20B isoform X1 [Megalopta genalis]XP_033331153.1 kinesin-like protein KIF20B isoform X1 [Megalopta genalis]
MDNTLDSIRPSCNLNAQDEVSYLFGRDPSILAYGQRPCISGDAKKNLMSVYEIEESNSLEETNSESVRFQTIKVYLRMKPFPKKVKLTQEQEEAYKILNSTTLLTKLPTTDNTSNSLKRSNSSDIVHRKFTFTQTFGPEITQLELFDQAVKQHMIDFLAGQNSTIMTYGTTSSGKSFTLQGSITSPGIIPRCLEFVFSNITSKPSPSYKPVNHCDVVSLGPLERAQELEMKTKLLTFASMDKHHYINAYTEMQKLLQEELPIRSSQCIDTHYSVWVSFAEIYNEIVYDLLSNETQKRRTPLKLVTDTQGTAFIKGLKTVCVNSGSEAYQVLMAGQYNLKVAATALNARSSRSHCIFTIKLLKYYVENEPNAVEVSTFAFCDLAGSERLKKTLNIGDRLKEAQNINTSLLVLGKCLKTIHVGQLSKQKPEHVGPFRESKLTRLFQKALSGRERMVLIVNINPLPNLYTETQNVLNFAAIAKKIVLEQKQKVHKKKSRFSQIVRESMKTVTDWDTTELESEEVLNAADNHAIPDYVHIEDYDELLCENKKLKDEIKLLKSSALSRDLEIRQEMADTYTAMMKDLEIEWKNHINNVEEQHEDILQWSVKQIEDFYKQRLDKLSSDKRKRSSILDDNVDDRKNIEELEIQNSQLTSKLVLLKSNVKQLKESNQTLAIEKNKLSFELDLIKRDMNNMKDLLSAAQKDVCTDEEATCYVEELKSQLFAKEDQVKKLKVFLNEAKEEYITITTEIREKEYTIKEQEEELLEKQETIDDLEADLVNINICLTKECKEKEALDEELENQNKKLLDYECKMENMLQIINKLECEKLELLNEAQMLKKAVSIKDSTEDSTCKNDVPETSHDSPKDDKYQEIAIKKEIFIDYKIKSLNKSTETDNYDPNTGNVEVNPLMREKILAVEIENSTLKEKLIQSTTEIQSLRDELDLAKVELKVISDQISNLQMNSIKTNLGSEGSVERKIEKEAATIRQVNENESQSECGQSVRKEEDTQTSFSGEFDETELILNELSKLMVKFDDTKSQLMDKCQMLVESKQEVSSLTQKLESLSEENVANKLVLEEYKNSIEVLKKQLSQGVDEMHLQKLLEDIDQSKVTLNIKIGYYERLINEVEKELLHTKDGYNQCMEKLNTLQGDFDNLISKCKDEHIESINQLKMDLHMGIEGSDIKTKCLDVHAAKITELEHKLDIVTELQQQIEELNKKLEICQDEKEHLQKLLDENNDKLLEFEVRLESAKDIEQEKDAEILSLQQEVKSLLQKTDIADREGKLMEAEIKNTIKELTETKDKLSQNEKHIENLESCAKANEQNAKILELLQQSAQERQTENDRLRNMNQELKNSLIEKEREMEAFMKNRDDMVTKYETLVRNQQEELEKQKQATVHHSKEKAYYEDASEDQVITRERRTRRPPRKYSPTSDVSVIELPGSETKRTGKRTVLPPPTESLSERRKNIRKKKLYVAGDESFHDIEPVECTETSTPTEVKTRSLRCRRK